MLGPIKLHINKTNFMQLLWERGFPITAHGARFYKVPPERSASGRLEWFLSWNTPAGQFEARIHRASPWRPMLWIKRRGAVFFIETLDEQMLMQYKMIGGSDNE